MAGAAGSAGALSIPRLRGLGRYALAFGDQGLTALLSLFVSLWLIRRGEPDAFGAWVFWSNAALVAATVATALTTVHLHRLPPGPPAARRRTEGAILSAGLVLATLSALLAALAVGLLSRPLATPATILFLPGTLLGFHLRALAASRGALGWAAGVSLLVLAAVVLGLLVLAALGGGTTAGEALCLSGLAQIAASAWALSRLSAGAPPDLGRGGRARWRVLLRRSGWPVAGGLAAEVSTRLYVFLVAAMAGTAALAALAAAQTLLRPATLLAGAWAATARVPLAHARDRGDHGRFARIVVLGALAPAAATIALGLALAAAWPIVSTHLYGGRFPDLAGTVLLWTATMATACLVLAAAVALQSVGGLRALAVSEMAGAAICAAVMPLALLVLPPAAALGAMVLGGAATVALGARALRRLSP